ncbi:MAG: dihydrodipicolinate synthase family protein [Proteobacteria bacterium]|nr:dihydrodipicolinate synthase family protein [Pseudomonadota bacterium]MDA0992254.1 dihydrodipicolinate synthase family protein [Pseudomonadota bacterium]
MTDRFSGVLSPVVTPFVNDLGPDADRLIAQCQWLLSQNVGLAVFGTNSEANSLSVDEKIVLLDRLVEAGIDTNRMMPGTGCCALTDTVKLTAHAAKLRCAGTLMLPPFYYKGVSDDGIFANFAEVIERVGNESLRIYLYHIPPVAQVGFSTDLIERLVIRYPKIIVGIKDSSGDWKNTFAMLERKWDDFRVFVGSESFLLANMRSGGAGCISATANVNPAAIYHLYQTWQDDDADSQQQALDEIRSTVMAYPMIPALKATVAEFSGDDQWRTVRPPLVNLAKDKSAELAAALRNKGFEMPGL